jgi:glutamate synthase (NADPH/NADH) large chain
VSLRAATPPGRQGLYDPSFEHDACGMGLVAQLHGTASHGLVDQSLTVLERLAHRGASGADPTSGDGAGIMLQVPDAFLRAEAARDGVHLAAKGAYLTGLVFFERGASPPAALATIERIAGTRGFEVIWRRVVPTDATGLGPGALSTQPTIHQLVLARREQPELDTMALERLGYVLRKVLAAELPQCYFPSLSARTIVYKGMLTSGQLRGYFPDLSDQRVESSIAIVHSRFSTNTFPSWSLAHPFRYIAHNGEINTIRGNRDWMRAREALLASPLFGDAIAELFPICTPGVSDSASFDEVLELLHLAGRSLPHALLMMIPEAWENEASMDPARRAFYRYHASLMEPWDGPAAVVFTDGTTAGASLDRNGLRPLRYWVMDDGLVVLASEVGVLDADPASVVRKGRVQPGRMFLIDTEQGRLIDDDEVKSELASAHPYGDWLAAASIHLDELPKRTLPALPHTSIVWHQRLFGYTHEELRLIIAPMASSAAEPVGSMGTDTPTAVLSARPRLVFDYFSQVFAQVTNPPLDAIREETVTSIEGTIGPEGNLLDARPESCRQISLPSPVIDRDDLAKLLMVDATDASKGFKAVLIDGLFLLPDGDAAVPSAQGAAMLEAAIGHVCGRVSTAIEQGANLIVLSDRNATHSLAPIPSLLLTAAVHHHLVREKTRTQVGLIVESGDAREVHHFALLVGFGAAAVSPYVALESIDDLIASGVLVGLESGRGHANYIKAASKGVLKVMSKMGISTVASYTGAQIFEAFGLSSEVIDRYFTGVASPLGGVGLDVLAAEAGARHRDAFLTRPAEHANRELRVGGEYQWRREGEYHLFNPRTVFKLQHATRSKRYEIFKEYTALVDDQSESLATLRGLLRLVPAGAPVPLDEVEPASSILARFASGAMSYGSISAEAHETIAIAMNRLGARSNTGEGGEDEERYVPEANGDSKRSAVKQVASGRFGVTSSYLVNADDLQIKISQGAKPGEGGQLPGTKVYPWIAKTRHSTPGVGLISPPPHHDIYSIEDLAQLIYDLKSANTEARIHVKLVAQVGVGTVAAGVVKAHADVVLISGHDGGTGAAPLTSLKHAGIPWELGLAETQQTLLVNGLRDRVVVQVDGQLKTGRDVVIAALLGAEEFGFATAPLVVAGCVMMRVCHLDTCPVGIATQNPELRSRFSGTPEFVETFFEFLAHEVREILASMGLRSIEEAIGRVDLLDVDAATSHWKANSLDLGPLLTAVEPAHGTWRRHRRDQDHGVERALERTILERAIELAAAGELPSFTLHVTNADRAIGTQLGATVTRRFGSGGLADDTITLECDGSAGQSFGAFLPAGVTLRLTGDANDYLGKGLSGGIIVVAAPRESGFDPSTQVIAGNVIGYGATSGELYLAGLVGERFCVRNSGAIAVVEGVGDHGCEYMTGGRVVVLGAVGRNFAAGMSGGVAYVYDPTGSFDARVNREMVDVEPLDGDDAEWLVERIGRFAARTGSHTAASLLADWHECVSDFKKVMPREYRRVLEAIAAADREGRPSDAAVMELAHG